MGLAALSVAAGVVLSSCGFQEPPLEPVTYEVLNRVEIPPLARQTAVMDAMVVDPATQTLYVADGTNTAHYGLDVIDMHTYPGKYVKFISTGDSIPSGLAIAPDVHRLYSGQDDGTADVIDIDPASPAYQTIVGKVPLNDKLGADLATYDPVDHLVFVNSPDDGFTTAIDSRTDKVVGNVENTGLIDQPIYDPVDGMIYVGAIDDNQLLKINPHTLKIVGKYPFSVACEPHGLAIDPTTDQGLIGCADKDEPVTISWNFRTEQPIKYFDLAGAGDLLIYDQKTDRFIFAASNYAPAEMAVFSGSPINYLTSVPTSH
ncbi:MAG: YncE family protein, partial [Thermoplasmata archaeon]